MAHLYHRSFDPNGQDSLAKLARLIPPGSQVLDVGAGPGILASYLTEQRACLVDGIEGDPVSASVGRRAFRCLWIVDLETAEPGDLVRGTLYDAIICADILEHLRDPERTLRQLVPLLAEGGRLLLSVPNTAYAGLIAELMAGEWRYREEGLLDRTHLRFFTRSSLQRLLEECGLQVQHFETVSLGLEQSEFPSERIENLPPMVRDFLTGMEDAETYQFIVSCSSGV